MSNICNSVLYRRRLTGIYVPGIYNFEETENCRILYLCSTNCFQIICHQCPPVWCWSCDNTNIHRVPEPTGPVLASCPHRNRFPYYFVTSSHWPGAGHVTTQTYTGYQSLLVRYWLVALTSRFTYYFVTSSHRSGAGHVTTHKHTPGSRAYQSGTGYSCPHRFPHFVTSSHRSSAGHVTSLINIHRVPEPAGLVVAAVSPSQIFPLFFTNGAGHV